MDQIKYETKTKIKKHQMYFFFVKNELNNHMKLEMFHNNLDI